MLFSPPCLERRSRIAPLAVSFAIGSLGCMLLAGAAHGAQDPDLVLSLTSSGTLPAGVVDDEELLLVGAGGTVRTLLPERALAFYFDAGAAGVHQAPSDVDAVDLHPISPGEPWVAGMYFSTVSDEGVFRDGDVLRFDPSTGAIEVAFAEAFLATAVGASDANVDVDALCIEDDGTLWFSLAEDEALSGGGVVMDDAVLRLSPGATIAQVVMDGVAMAAAVESALGQPTAIGDVKGLDVLDGDLLFTIQSPSAHDATVFTTAQGGAIYDQRTEDALGFQGAVEADALAVLPTAPFVTLDLSAPALPSGQSVTVSLSGLSPGAPFLILMSGAPLYSGGLATSGFGVFALDPLHPLWTAGLQNAPALLGVAGSGGIGLLSGTVPSVGGGAFDLFFQAVTLGGSTTNPAVLEVNQ